MTPDESEQPERGLAAGLAALSPGDARALDRLLDRPPAGDTEPAQVEEARVERVRGLLGVLGAWPGANPDNGLAGRAYAAVLASDPPALSPDDGEALDALIALRRAGLQAGPMPAGSQARAQHVSRVLSLLGRAPNEPVPADLAARTLKAIEHDRLEQRRRSAMSAASPGKRRPGGFNVRQLATTAALLLMVLSVLLPVIDKGRSDAMIAQCGQNLAGLGADLQAFAYDNKENTRPYTASPAMFRELSSFARREVDGSSVPSSRASLFLLLGEDRLSTEHTTCPAAEHPNAPEAYYNGQNPVAGGPVRLFLEPRPIYADANPLYRLTPRGLVRDRAIPGLTRSRNHGGGGQNVLIGDGSVRWTVRPAVLRGDRHEDNIWLLQGSGGPGDPPDVFLTP